MLSSVADNLVKPFIIVSKSMATTIRYDDLVESVAAALQYIS